MPLISADYGGGILITDWYNENNNYRDYIKISIRFLTNEDLTGAGDLFAAGYLHGIINNLSIKESLIKGTELSSKIIQKIGARI